MAPFGGIRRKLAPNVVACAFPTGGEFPIVVEVSTSAIPEGKVRLSLNKGQPGSGPAGLPAS